MDEKEKEEPRLQLRLSGNCHNFIRCEDATCPVRLQGIMKCWEYFADHPEESKKHYCNLEIHCENCHYRQAWELGIISENHFDAVEFIHPDQFGNLADGMEAKIAPCGANETTPPPLPPRPGDNFRCWTLTNCKNLECTVRKRGIIRCWEHWEGMTPENILKYRGHSFNCKTCHVYHGWQLGLLNEKLFKGEFEKNRRINKKINQYRIETLFGEYLQKMESAEHLSRQEELALAQRIGGGDEKAAELLLIANFKLVAGIARKFLGRGFSFFELIQEGNLGLVKALSKFEWAMGNRFSTYATFWIRQSIMTAVSTKNRIIHIPVKVLVMSQKILRTIESLKNRESDSPTLEKLGQVLNLDPEDIIEIIRITRLPVSLEGSSDDDKGAGEITLLPSPNQGPEGLALEKIKKATIEQALDKLSDKERFVVRHHFGLNDVPPRSLAEIGRELEISRERARQLLNQGLARLKDGYLSRHLKEFIT